MCKKRYSPKNVFFSFSLKLIPRLHIAEGDQQSFQQSKGTDTPPSDFLSRPFFTLFMFTYIMYMHATFKQLCIQILKFWNWVYNFSPTYRNKRSSVSNEVREQLLLLVTFFHDIHILCTCMQHTNIQNIRYKYKHTNHIQILKYWNWVYNDSLKCSEGPYEPSKLADVRTGQTNL